MTRGIRQFTNETFNNTLPQLPELGAIAFRREVMAQVMMAFEISVASAATHYNHSLKQAKLNNPEAVATLGRAEDKKGGRKPVHPVDVIKVKTGEVVATGVSKAVAQALIDKAAASPNKPRLAIKVVEVATDAVAETAVADPIAEAMATGAMAAEAAAA